MEKLKELKIVLLVLLLVLVLVIVRTTGKNRFKQDAQNAIEAVKTNNFFVSLKDFKGSENQYLIIDLSESSSKYENSIKISFEKLLEETALQKLKETDNKILLVSNNNSVTVKAWVILNQLNFKNVFVLLDEEYPEALQYEFQPGTMARLESVSE